MAQAPGKTLPDGLEREGLRERKKARTREALSEAALRLCEKRGFTAVTVDEIAAAAEVSRSTFFRYFASKEAVLFTWRDPLLERFEVELARQEPGESAFGSVRRACLAIGEHYQRNREKVLRHQAVVSASPALVGYEFEVDRRWEDAIARALLARFGGGEAGRRRAAVLAGATMGVLRAILREWFLSEGRLDLLEIGNEALDQLENPTDLAPPGRGGG